MTERIFGGEGSYEVKVISDELDVNKQLLEATMTERNFGGGEDILPVPVAERALTVQAEEEGFGTYELTPVSPHEQALVRDGARDEANAELQEQAIAALVEQPTVRDAAEAAGVGKTTLYRWLLTPEFKKRYLAARREAVSQGVGRLQRAMYQAVDALEGIAADPHAPAGARIAAARTIVTQALKGVEVEDLLARVERLEDDHGETRQFNR